MDKIQAGYGRIRITPPLGVELCGYGYFLERRATGVMDDLFANALYLEHGEQRFLLIASDLIGYRPDISQQVRQAVRKAFRIPDQAIFLHATHTHTGPATHALEGCGEMDADYLAALPALLIEAARRAVADIRPVTQFSVCETMITPFSWNRAIPNGPLDSHVRGFQLKRRGARPIAVVSYGCHPVTYKIFPNISADWPGAVVRSFDAKDIDAVCVVGPCGDVNPILEGPYEKDQPARKELIRVNGQSVADAFVARLKPQSIRSFKALGTNLTLNFEPLDEADIEHEIARNAAAYPGAPVNTVVGRWADLWRARFRQAKADGSWKRVLGSSKPYSQSVEVRAFSMGSVLLVGVPFEIFQKYRDLLAEAFPGHTVLVGGNTTTTYSYLASREKLDLGGYEARDSMYLYHTLPAANGALEKLAADTAKWLKKSGA